MVNHDVHPSQISMAEPWQLSFGADATKQRSPSRLTPPSARSHHYLRRNHASKFPSRKNGRFVHREGLLELDTAYLFEANPRIAQFREHSITITYPDGSRIRRYTPDFELELTDGQKIWVEIKPLSSLAHADV